MAERAALPWLRVGFSLGPPCWWRPRLTPLLNAFGRGFVVGWLLVSVYVERPSKARLPL